MIMVYKLIATLLVLVIGFLGQRLLRVSIDKFVEARQIKRVRGELVGRIARWLGWGVIAILLISVWGVDTQNLWLFATSVVGVLAVGFFASWSMLSNLVAGLFLFFSDPFKIDDEIVVLPEDIRGTVIDIKALFVVLEDSQGNVLHIPTNLLFQKTIKKINPSHVTAGQ